MLRLFKSTEREKKAFNKINYIHCKAPGVLHLKTDDLGCVCLYSSTG